MPTEKMQTADLAMYALYIGIFISSDSGRAGRNDAKFRRFLMLWKQSQRYAPDARELTDVKGLSYEHVSFFSDEVIDIPAGSLLGPSGGGYLL